MTAVASSSSTTTANAGGIKPIDQTSVHRITSGQVVIDLQTAVKELVENSIDAGATNIEVKFKQYGLRSIEVIDNGSGIEEKDYESIALKHHTSKLSTFTDLTLVRTFGFRGEALSSLCALCESVSVTTSTQHTAPMGVILEMAASGKIKKRTPVARQKGTTVTLTNLFLPLPVRRKELERNVKREFSKALGLLNAYALGPCAAGSGVRLTVSNVPDKGSKSIQLRTTGTPNIRSSVTSLWGPKAMENIIELYLQFEVERDKVSVKRVSGLTQIDTAPLPIQVRGLISKFTPNAGRAGTDRQFLYVNGRPCNLTKIQKAFNETYRTFNATQNPFIVADFIVPTESCDINVSPDKRTIFLHSEGNLVNALKSALEEKFSPSRATFDLASTQSQRTQSQQGKKGKEVQSVLDFGRKGKEGEEDDKEDGAEEEEEQAKAAEARLRRFGHGSQETPMNVDEGDEEQDEVQMQKSKGNCPKEVSQTPKSTRTVPEEEEEEPVQLVKSSVTNNTRKMDLKARMVRESRQKLIQQNEDEEETGVMQNKKNKDQPQSRRSEPQRSSPTSFRWSGPQRSPPAPLHVPDPDERSMPPPPPIPQSTPSAPSAPGDVPVEPLFRPAPGSILHSEGSSAKEPLFIPDEDDEMEVDEGQKEKENGGVVSRGGVDADAEMGGGEGDQDQRNEDWTSPKKRSKEKGEVMVLDTSQAVWSQSLTQASEQQNEGEDSGPARKKRRSDAASLDLSGISGKGTGGSLTLAKGASSAARTSSVGSAPRAAKESREHLRSRIVGFARTGSQVPIVSIQDDEEETEEEVEVDQLDEEVWPSSPVAGLKAKGKERTSDDTSSMIIDDDESTVVAAGTSSSTVVSADVEGEYDDDEYPPDPASILSQALANESSKSAGDESHNSEVVKSADHAMGDVTLRFDAVEVAERWKRLSRGSAPLENVASAQKDSVLAEAGLAEEQEKAEQALARVIEKEDFANMEVLGQFNLGFIVVRRRKGGDGDEPLMDDLFIVDQHAADEKYNFETLQQTTRIQSQKLFRPKPLELTASDQVLALENVEVLRQNGFEVDVRDDDGNENGTSGLRLEITAQPVSKNTVFDMKDLEEIVHLMRDRPAGQMVRCSKARAMFASRACRKSVMIGMALNNRQMSSVVRHMGSMDQPWNCPHGRPTMRHLLNMADVSRSTGFGEPAAVDWSAFE